MASQRVIPVARRWFNQQVIDDRITLITEPHVDSLLAANTWWIHGSERDAAIDTGLGVASLRTKIPALFEHSPLAVVTHAHLDHMGGAHEFSEVAAHADEIERIAQVRTGSLYGKLLFAELGLEFDDDVPELLISALPHAGYDPSGYRLHPVPDAVALEDGDSIDLGDATLTVLHLPGHTAGSIALFDERRGELFTGDVVYDDELLDEIVDANIPQYLDTMRRLRNLDVSVVHAGHGHSFDRARLTDIADAYLRHREEV